MNNGDINFHEFHSWLKSSKPRVADQMVEENDFVMIWMFEAWLSSKEANQKSLIDVIDNLLWYVSQLEPFVYADDEKDDHEIVEKAKQAILKARS